MKKKWVSLTWPRWKRNLQRYNSTEIRQTNYSIYRKSKRGRLRSTEKLDIKLKLTKTKCIPNHVKRFMSTLSFHDVSFPDPIMTLGTLSHVQKVRLLYKSCLKLHRGLPIHLKAIGDTYVKDEFKRHKTAEQAQVQVFMEAWAVRMKFHLKIFDWFQPIS